MSCPLTILCGILLYHTWPVITFFATAIWEGLKSNVAPYNTVYVSPTTTPKLFSPAELKKLHLHFYHPSASRLYAFLRRSDPERTPLSTSAALESFNSNCAYYRPFPAPPFRFRSSLPLDELRFNYEVSMDLLWLESGPVIHIVCTQTNFQGAAVLR